MALPALPGIPEQIARYKLLSELGRGSMGHVYLALDPNIERKVALKIFLPLLKVGVAEQWELRQRFILEARAAGQLNHPGIVTIFDADTDPDTGLSYLAMEWVDGPSLDDLIRESGPLAVDRTVAIVEQVATALDAAHRQGLVHRDIKPANILLENNGRAKVTDFGIAKLASMSITTTGWIPGSPVYMSPEQIRNEGIDRRSDLYSLGAALYQCLTGLLPFEADSLAALTHMILEIDPRPARSINPAVTADLAAVIDTAMAKSPDDRFESGREFAQALRLAKAGKFGRTVGGRTPRGARRGAAERAAADVSAGAGTRTVGLVAGAPDDNDPLAPDRLPLCADPPVLEDEPAPVPSIPVDELAPRGSQGLSAPARVRRLALAMAVVFGLLAVWSLRPVESEPATDPPAAARLFSTAPRFDTDAPPAGRGVQLPAEPGQPAEPAEAPFQAPASSFGRRSVPPLAKPAAPAPSTSTPPRVVAVDPAEVEPVGEVTLPEIAAVPARTRVVGTTSTLELVYRNRLKNASLSVWIDGEHVHTSNVEASPNLFKRVRGENVWASVAVTPGEHLVDVRITGTDGKVDLVRQATATFEDGRTNRLRVVVTPLKNLRLNWKESPVG